MKERAATVFSGHFGEAPAHIVRAPGRVNLIGEHTDYNLGYSLPMAIDREVWIALRPREDSRVLLHSLDFENPTDFDLGDIQRTEGWADYVHGMSWALQTAGLPLRGWEGVLLSDVPVASGLSSSAAIELAVARAFWALSPWNWDSVSIARLAQKHENEWMGLKSGVMDQMISAIGARGKAFLIDFRDLSFKAAPLPKGIVVAVLDTRVPRGLVESAYNARVDECARAAAYFGVSTLRDVTLTDFEAATDLDQLLRKRADHVITENDRTLKAHDAILAGSADELGALMTDSHVSLRDDYEVSCDELDLMVALSLEQAGCYGARMTGAGFGGCAIALVEENYADGFVSRVASGYEQRTGIEPEVYVCQAADGAAEIQ